ncbi:radical SAM protein, partial [Candidatus Omnitrophota bacterium]
KPSYEEKKELSTEGKLSIIRDIGRSGVWLLSFCIAEPLLMDDLGDLIGEAKKQKMLVNISTNGSKLEECSEMLCAEGVDIITVSIDSHDPAVHDDMRGFPGLFDKAEKGIERIKTLRKGKRPWIVVRHLVNGRTYFEIDKFLEYWRDKGDEVVMKPVTTTPDGMYHVPENMFAKPGDEEKFRAYYKDILEKYTEIDNPYHRAIPDYIFGADDRKEYYCFAGTFFADIDQEGNLYSCIESGERFGSLREEDFIKIWGSDRMGRFRQDFKASKKCTGCWGDRFLAGIQVQRVLEQTGGL